MPDTKTPQKPTNSAPARDFVRDIAKKISESENILVTLSRNPSVDEISAALGLTIFLDKLGKHATAIYSGTTPNVLEFLHPEQTFEANTDSLQDFIVTLNKDKADHLRYNIDGDYVKIYITPYKTTIDESDLEFSHGDYNVDLIIALNVPTPNDLDAALTEHGKIMHDASAIDITTGEPGKFGEIEWSEPTASSISEMAANLLLTVQDQKHKLDQSTATAFLTGIIAATERFSNNKTTPKTMNIASELMKLGADQQVIASNLEAGISAGSDTVAAEPEDSDPTRLSITHGPKPKAPADSAPAMAPPTPSAMPAEPAPVAQPAAPAPTPSPAPAEPTAMQHGETQLQPLHDNIVPETPSAPAPTPAPVAEAQPAPAPQPVETQAEPVSQPATSAPTPAAMPAEPAPVAQPEPIATPAETAAPEPAPTPVSEPAPAPTPEIPAQPMGAVDLVPSAPPDIPTTPPIDNLPPGMAELPPSPDDQTITKDYGKMMDDALAETTLQGDKPVEPTTPLVTNMAAAAAPPVMAQPEANSVPEISYNQAQPASEANPPQPVPMPEAINLPPPPNPPMPDMPPMPGEQPAAQPMTQPVSETQPAPQPAEQTVPAAQPADVQPAPAAQPESQPAPTPETQPEAQPVQVPVPEATPTAQPMPGEQPAAQPTEAQAQPQPQAAPQPDEPPAEEMPAPAVTPDMFQIPTT